MLASASLAAPKYGWWPERLAAFLAFAGLLFAIFFSFSIRTLEAAGSDFKTMYASAVCLAHGLDAYRFANLARVFALNGVVQPASWYAHAPVYPPFTLGLLRPFTHLSMVVAVYTWIIVSGLVLAAAVASLARYAGKRFGLPRRWRMLLIAMAAASPLVSFAFEVGNVSVVVGGLSLLAFTTLEDEGRWGRALGFALALLLKPHIAVWFAVAFLFLPGTRGRELVMRASAIAFLATGLLCGYLAWHGDLARNVASYQTMLHAELSGGSMDTHQRDVLSVAAQITSFTSLAGYLSNERVSAFLTRVVLASLLALLLLVSFAFSKMRRQAPELLVAAWCAFGLVVTYHRAHDASALLLLLLPGTLSGLRRGRDAWAWMTVALGAGLSTGFSPETLSSVVSHTGGRGVAELLLYRQAPLAALLLALLVAGELAWQMGADGAAARWGRRAFETAMT